MSEYPYDGSVAKLVLQPFFVRKIRKLPVLRTKDKKLEKRYKKMKAVMRKAMRKVAVTLILSLFVGCVAPAGTEKSYVVYWNAVEM